MKSRIIAKLDFPFFWLIDVKMTLRWRKCEDTKKRGGHSGSLMSNKGLVNRTRTEN